MTAITRREWFTASAAFAAAARKPNIILVMTDDQGFPDTGFHGNQQVRTPHLDQLAKESVECRNFCVSPLCAPTRASLMTGRYYYRTGVTDTYKGRAILDPRETTLAEMLRGAGYATGIFGKWHLGDCYPCRPIDKGFDEELVHLGGGLAQPSASREDGGYFNPRLRKNGKFERVPGYCTDIFTDAAIGFMERNRTRPFFVYLPTNSPHDPYIVEEKFSAPYKQAGLPEKVANIYGMIENIDGNLGRILRKLDEWKLRENTIFVFLTDNGPTNQNYTAGLRNQKGSVYEGGIRSPLLVRWPERLQPAKVERMAGVIDLTPTLLDAAGVKAPAKVKFDGRSLLPLLANPQAAWPDRTLFIQVHRGDQPDRYRNFCARTETYKLLHNVPIARPNPDPVRFELYDLSQDPGERRDLAAAKPEVVAKLKAAYDAWFDDVCATRGFAPVRFIVGTKHENPTELQRQDWRGPKTEWNDPDAAGYWEIEVRGGGAYDVACRFPAVAVDGTAELKLGAFTAKQALRAGAASCRFEGVKLPRGAGRLEVLIQAGSGAVRGAHFIDVHWRGARLNLVL